MIKKYFACIWHIDYTCEEVIVNNEDEWFSLADKYQYRVDREKHIYYDIAIAKSKINKGEKFFYHLNIHEKKL